ncbi:MAG: polyprenyl synthetase family protein [Deltaproteobacteria bacterium]|jgi:geranylgeranyl pyrophosphate synthase|nr:polyprenyl synthetase family protein [Deltaproteobacteria bacterium]
MAKQSNIPDDVKDYRDFNQWQTNSLAVINNELHQQLNRDTSDCEIGVKELIEAMHHTIKAGGKRLRGLFVLAAADSLGGAPFQALEAAIAVELIHAYSLIHDDLPALDNDDLRRGQPTCHLVYGEATAILAGDALQSLAYQMLTGDQLYYDIENPPTAEQRLKAIFFLSHTTGVLGMVAGQAMDMALEHAKPDLCSITSMEILKTGSLMAASMAMGGVLAGADDKMVDCLLQTGLQAGMAFQVQDDILNYSGNPAVMGKNVGTDAKKGKASIVSLIGPKKASLMATKAAKKALEHCKDIKSSKLERLIKSVVHRVR